jgi:hypothetical protein
MPNPSSDLQKLRSRIDQIAKSMNLIRTQLFFIPAENGESDQLNLMFKLTPDALMSDEEKEKRKIDSEFEALTASVTDDTEDKLEQARKEAKDHLDEWFKD